MERFVTKSIARCVMNWRICSRNGGSADGESRRTAPNGDKRVVLWASLMKRVVIICRSLRKVFRRATFIVARIANRNFPASAVFVGQLRVSFVAENTIEENSIRAFA